VVGTIITERISSDILLEPVRVDSPDPKLGQGSDCRALASAYVLRPLSNTVLGFREQISPKAEII
jgi:hypothetical protein